MTLKTSSGPRVWIIRIVIALLLLTIIAFSRGSSSVNDTREANFKGDKFAELEEKFARIFCELESKILVGALYFAEDLPKDWPDAAALESRVRSMVEEALYDPTGQNQGEALLWTLRYEIAIGLVFDLDTRVEALLALLARHASNDDSGQDVDRALHRVAAGLPIEYTDVDLLKRELGTAGKALALKLGDEAQAPNHSRGEIVSTFYRLAILGGLIAAGLVAGTFLTLLYAIVFMFGFARRAFVPAGFEAESLLWTWGAYLGVMFASGIVLHGLFGSDSIRLTLAAQMGVIFATLLLLALPVCAGAPWREVREAVGLRVFGVAALFKDLCIGPSFYLASLLPLGLFLMVFSALLSHFKINMSDATHPVVFILMDPDNSDVLVLTIVLGVIVAPIVEEIMFRGVLYAWLRARLTATSSIALSSLIFAAIHPQGMIGVPILFMIGCFLGILREWRGSLVAPVLFHACVNGGTMLLLVTALRAGVGP